MFRNVSIPQRLDDCQKCQAKQLRVNEVKGEISRLNNELTDVLDKINESFLSATPGEAAHRVVRDGIASLHGVSSLQSQVATIRAKIAVLNQALAIATQELDEARDEANRQIVESRKPEYEAIVGKIKAAVLAFKAAAAVERAFRHRASDDGLSLSAVLYLMSVDGSLFDGWLTAAQEHYSL
jgi:hypothetical protein